MNEFKNKFDLNYDDHINKSDQKIIYSINFTILDK